MALPQQPATIEDLLAHADWLRALARQLVSNAEQAGDVEQETWLAAIARPPQDASAPRKWLAQVLRNVVNEQRRSEAARRAREASVARTEAVEGGQESVDRAQTLRVLVEHVLALDEPYRSTLLLRYQDGLSAEQIASRQGVPSSTVRNRLGRGVAELRERLQRDHGEAWSAVLAPLIQSPPTTAAASLAVIATMSKLKLVSTVAVILVIGCGLWWKLSDSTASAPASVSAPLAKPSVETPEEPSIAGPARVVAPDTISPVVPENPAKDSRRGSLVAKVTWSDKSPAEGVVITMLPWGESSSFALESSRVTDSEGIARFEEVASGLTTVLVDRAGGAMAQVRGGEVTEVPIKIAAGMLVRGQVLDGLQRPVAFARIWLSEYLNFDGAEIATADAAGRFTLRDVGEARRVAARAAGFAPSLSTFVKGKPGDTVDVVIELPSGGGDLRGTVRAADGSAIAGAAVHVGREALSRRQTKDGREADSAPGQRLTSDEHGEFVATGIESGPVFVQCRARDSAPWQRDVEVAAQGVTRIAIELGPGAAIDGLVRGIDGRPAVGVQINLGKYGSFASTNSRSADDGSFHLEGLAPGKASLRFSADARGSAQVEAILVAGETLHVDVQLTKAGSVSGRVLDSKAAPLEGWRVAAVEKERPTSELRKAVTDPQGGFTLDNWPAKADAIVVREPESTWGPPALLVSDFAVGSSDLLLTIPAENLANAFIIGRLRGPNGEPVADASFRWAPSAGLERITTQYPEDVDPATGNFRAGPLPAGRYAFMGWSETQGSINFPERDVLSNQTLDLGELRFPAIARVRVKLVGPRELLEAPEMKYVRVMVRRPSEFIAIGTVEHFDERLEGLTRPLEPGTYTFDVMSQTMLGSSSPIELRAGEEPLVEVTLERATSRTLLLTWASGIAPKEPIELSVTDAQGKVVMKHKLPVREGSRTGISITLGIGTYRVEVQTTDGRSAQVSFEIKSLEPVDHSRAPGSQIELQVR